MPSVTYYGSFDGIGGYNGATVHVDGESIPSGMTITDVSFTLRVKANKYSSSYAWVLSEFAIGDEDGSPDASSDSATMNSSDYTFRGDMDFTQSDVSKFASGSFDVYAKAYTTYSSASSYLWEFTITVEYEEYSACGAPTACSVNNTLATSNVTLSWSGASGGTGNYITGYEVQRRESSDGSSWGSWSHLTTTSSTSLSVAPPTTAGNYYQYRVRTLGSAGSAYYSGWKESTNTLRKDHTPLGGFTDTLTAGVTPIKALHMTELQNAVNTLRAFYGLSAYGFTTITAGTTSLAGWSAHVAELRAAIDQMNSNHETWITISVNCPRVDVMEQLRKIVLDI